MIYLSSDEKELLRYLQTLDTAFNGREEFIVRSFCDNYKTDPLDTHLPPNIEKTLNSLRKNGFIKYSHGALVYVLGHKPPVKLSLSLTEKGRKTKTRDFPSWPKWFIAACGTILLGIIINEFWVILKKFIGWTS